MVASKRADRDASEGAVLAGTTEDKKFGALVVLNCETDFVAKNENFVEFTNNILKSALSKKPENLESLKKISLDGRTIEAQVTEQTGVIGEKLDLSFYGKDFCRNSGQLHSPRKQAGICCWFQQSRS